MHTAAVLGSGVPGADEKRVAQVMGAIADRVTDQFVNPYTFPSTHKRILEPYNYYDFGQVCPSNLSLHLPHMSPMAFATDAPVPEAPAAHSSVACFVSY